MYMIMTNTNFFVEVIFDSTLIKLTTKNFMVLSRLQCFAVSYDKVRQN